MRRADHVRWSTRAATDGMSSGRPVFLVPDGTSRSESAYGVRFLFTGREWLAPVGLYDYRHRAYGSALGRFYQCDPCSRTTQRYAMNRVVGEMDPLGLWTLQIGFSYTVGLGMGGHGGSGLALSYTREKGLRVGLYSFGGAGWIIPGGVSIGVDVTWSANESISHIRGETLSFGGSVGVGPVVGGEVNVPTPAGSGTKPFWTATLAKGLSGVPFGKLPPLEIHAFKTLSWVFHIWP